MKKLMIAAAAAAMVSGVYAACSDAAECVAWNLSMKLKTLAAKKTTCKDACGDKTNIYYLDSATRTLKGYLWACEYDCEDATDLMIVLWDTKAKKAIIPCAPTADGQATIEAGFADMMVYGKKASKVAASFVVDHDNIQAIMAGVNGSIGKNKTSCYLKSLSGYVAGDVVPLGVTTKDVIPGSSVGGICGDKDIPTCEDEVEPAEIVYTTLCAVCCEWDGWCDAADLEEVGEGDLVPAVGTWSMKFNKKLTTTDNTMWNIVPAYAR